MTVLDVLNSPWAILPDRLEEIHAIYGARLRGEEPDLAAIEARIGKPLASEPQGYEVRDGAALVLLRGVLAQRMNLMSNISGGTSTELFARDVRQALEDPAVRSIIVMADTPGGAVAGTQSAADVVRSARGRKPIATFAEGMMASAGVWIGTAADQVILSDGSTQVGSIGVVATHTDVSKREEAMGIKTTEIVAGKYKRAASQYGPLTEIGRATIQEQVDYLYGLFVSDVAQNRGVNVDDVLNKMADGRMFIGQQAIDAGIADQITSLDVLIAQLNDRANAQARTTITVRSVSSMTPTEQAAQWAAENPEAAAVLRAEGRIEGAQGERDRIAAVRAQSMPGHESLIEALAADGHTTGPEAAMAVVAAENALRKVQAQARQDEAPAPVAFAPAPEGLEVKAEAPAAEIDPQALASRAREIKADAAAKGRTLTDSQAVAQARRELTNA
ncbi:MAG: S49 family peptidase [Burkholderiaceae bacterium]